MSLIFTSEIDSLNQPLKRNETDPFLKRIITVDKKWIVYDIVVQKRSSTVES